VDSWLDSKYVLEEGTVLLSGIQALVRVLLDQRRADRRAGLRTAALVSGYRGSPLGGLDIQLQRASRLLAEHDVRFLPGVNEDLGATAVFGSQLTSLLPGAKYDGVLGMWYGKAPGVDRSGDAFKHANFAGVSSTGGVLAVAGDDATAKSSTLPSGSEAAFFDALMPVLTPGNIQEILDLGRYGFELSRYSGLWVGFKMATEVADAFATARVAPDRIAIVDPGFEVDGKRFRASQSAFLAAPVSLALEREIHRGRLAAARAFSRAQRLNRVTVSGPRDRIGIAAPGKTYYDLREALSLLGLAPDDLHRFGIRLLQVRMPFPLETDTVREFARGLEEILVLEEKRSFLELFLKEALYHERSRPRIVGKTDEVGAPLVPADGALDADVVSGILLSRLASVVPPERLETRRGLVGFLRERVLDPLPVSRSFHFCSGCPHNRSTTLPEGSLAGAGIGCHAMAMMMDRSTVGITHMGGEGIQWVGMSPFTETPHLFQNLGDGTLFHSGTLAIRQAVASGANITFKILYNGAVAMTGGQAVDGAMPIPALVRSLEAEGVKRVLVVSDDRSLGDVWSRERLDEVQRLLREIPGTTALIYDQHCAAELRRKRRRGEIPTPEMRIFINESVCEGCGDCGRKSSCASLFPVETELGRKTQVHQSSCNEDYSCLEGDCPSFLEVVPTPGRRREREGGRPTSPDVALPGPENRKREANIYMIGIGGTGVVTACQILATAAALEDKHVVSLDQTGLSQKGGPVVSHLKIVTDEPLVSNQIAAGAADVYIAFDILTAAQSQHLTRARSDRTVAVVSTSAVPTGHMVTHVEDEFPDPRLLRKRIDSHSRAADNAYFDAMALSEHFFGDHLPANTILLGAAYQKGLLPLSKWSLEKAIELNGASVEINLGAFRLGRRIAAEPQFLEHVKLERDGRIDLPVPPPEGLDSETRTRLEAPGLDGELQHLLRVRASELVRYQDGSYARRYLDFVQRTLSCERERVANGSRLTEAVARQLFKLMAYKDEYEVARLHTRPELSAALSRSFGEGASIRYRLHPPLLRALGLRRKLAFGSWFRPALRALARLKFLRGTPFDPFGYAHMRRLERELIEEYRALVARVLEGLTPERYEEAIAIAELPDGIRGYEEVKLANVERFRKTVREREGRWAAAR
jgi:indolepyruvate ferredoxin oxidoreductase